MSSTKPSRLNAFLKDLVIPCLIGCASAFYEGKEVMAWGFLVTALVFRLTARVETRLDAIDSKMPEPTPAFADEPDKYGEDNYHLNLTTTELEEKYGWDKVTVYTQPFLHYVRQRCWGGPPVSYETWEYDFKWGGDFMFHRLRDDHTEDLRDSYFEVVNGCVQEQLIRQRDAENDTGLKFSTPEKDIADFKQRVEWHEADGVVRYFILSRVRPHGGWKRDAEKLKEGISSLGAKAEQIGGKIGEYGWYRLPDEATPEQKQAMDKLFSPPSLRSHGFRSFRDWNERDQIIKLLEPEPAQETPEASN